MSVALEMATTFWSIVTGVLVVGFLFGVSSKILQLTQKETSQ